MAKITQADIDAENDARFDDAVDEATHAVMEAFEWLGLPDEPAMDQRGELIVRINDAIAGIMREYK